MKISKENEYLLFAGCLIIMCVLMFVAGFKLGAEFEREDHECPTLESQNKCYGPIDDSVEVYDIHCRDHKF